MFNVDLSNIWSQVSLPELLGEEKTLFDAHLALRSNAEDERPFHGWLGASESVTAKTLHTVRRCAEQIRACCDYLLVVGNGGSFSGAKAAVCLLGGDDAARILFAGTDLSSQAWLELCRKIEGKDVCLHLISPRGEELEPCIASRAIRWLMERRYGTEAKTRIYVSALAQTPMAQMANEEGYTLLPMPQETGGWDSAVSSAALLPMAVAGIEPLDVLEGAAEAYQSYDIRAFENPVWLYAGARLCLKRRQFHTELFSVPDPAAKSLGSWWQHCALRHTLRGETGLLVTPCTYPDELDLYDRALTAQSRVFETLLQFELGAKQVAVEMDWKDYDNLGYLADTTLEQVRKKTVEALCATHGDRNIPVISIDAPQLSAPMLGELFGFFELSAALCAYASGIDCFSQSAVGDVRACAEGLLREK